MYILKERLTVHSFFFLISHKSTFEDLRCSESFFTLGFLHDVVSEKCKKSQYKQMQLISHDFYHI